MSEMSFREDDPIPIPTGFDDPEYVDGLLAKYWQFVNTGLPMEQLKELKENTQKYLLFKKRIPEIAPVRQNKFLSKEFVDLSGFMD